MTVFFAENSGTIVVAIILLVIISAIIVKLIRDKKKGKCMCSCGCSGCPSQGTCSVKKSDNS